MTKIHPLAELYECDETAWLEAMAQLSAEHRFAEMDHVHLTEYLADMAKRDRRETYSRLVVLLTHLLKWEHQVQQRGSSWLGTIVEQRRELRQLVESKTLRLHAETVMADAYEDARKQAAAETSLPKSTFASRCPWNLDDVLADEDA